MRIFFVKEKYHENKTDFVTDYNQMFTAVFQKYFIHNINWENIKKVTQHNRFAS